MKKKLILSLLMIFLLSFMTGCFGNKNAINETHSKQEMLDSIDSLNCGVDNSNRYYGYIVSGVKTTNDSLLSCNLKNKYTILNEETSSDKDGYETRKIDLRLNDYNVEFSVTSSRECTSAFSATCTTRSYVITTNYQEKVSEYFTKKYDERNNNLCSSIGTTNYTDGRVEFYVDVNCLINKNAEITNAVKYVNEYIDYINNLNIRFMQNNASASIEFPSKKNQAGSSYKIYMGIKLLNGKYSLVVTTLVGIEYKQFISDNITDLNDYILNFIEENEIF
jgi:hypothetical protein